MTAQEFSSPGAHMSGSDNGSSYSSNKGSQIAYANPNAIYSSGSSSGVSNNVPIYYGTAGSNGSSAGSAKSYLSVGDISSIYDFAIRSAQDMANLQYSNNKNLRDLAEEYNSQAVNSANKANKFTERMIDKQMQFQQYNSDTSYQRAVQDLKKAGLNPILAYINGGASQPAGSSASGQAAYVHQAGYDQGYGVSGVISNMMNSILPLTLAGLISHNSGVQKAADSAGKVVEKTGDFVGKIFDFFGSGIKKKASDKAHLFGFDK